MSKIVHLMVMDKFLPPFIDFLRDRIDLSDHRFVFIGPAEYKYGLDGSYPVEWVSDALSIKALGNQLVESDRLIIHGLWSHEVDLILYNSPSLLRKSFWVMWGGDFYEPDSHTSIRKYIIRNVGYLVTPVDGDVSYVRRTYGSTGTHIRCFAYTSNLFNPVGVKERHGDRINIIAGNSADPTNRHLEIFDKLRKFKSKNIKIFAPLSYGDSHYADKVIQRGYATFKDKFVPLVDFIPYGKYLEFLSTMDIGIFSHRRQQAMGNIIATIGMGKKVFLSKASPVYDLFKNMGVTVYPDDRLDLDGLSDQARLSNISIIKDSFNEESLLEGWSNIFNMDIAGSKQAYAHGVGRNDPFFSVVIPVYNRELYLKEAMRSVLSQDFENFELIVSDDGSTDRSLEIAEDFEDPRIRIVRGQHAGGAAARNKGIAAARGRFIVWVDSDDIQEAGALSLLYRAAMDTPDADMFYGDLIAFDEAEPRRSFQTSYPDYYNQDILPGLIKGNMLPNGGSAVRRSLYEKYGGYDVSFWRCHDYQIWSRFADKAKFKKVDAVLYRWRLHPNSLSHTTSRFYEGRVVVDMFDRYPVSRLFPDLSNDEVGPALLNVADILESLREYGLAARILCRAASDGYSNVARIKDFMRKAEPEFSPLLTCLIRASGNVELLLSVLRDLENQDFYDFNVNIIGPFCPEIEQQLIRDWPVVDATFYTTEISLAEEIPVRLLDGSTVVWLDESARYPSDYLKNLHAELVTNQRRTACIGYVE